MGGLPFLLTALAPKDIHLPRKVEKTCGDSAFPTNGINPRNLLCFLPSTVSTSPTFSKVWGLEDLNMGISLSWKELELQDLDFEPADTAIPVLTALHSGVPAGQ